MKNMGSAGDAAVLGLASRHMLSGYDASYLALAKAQDVPLATLDKKLAGAAHAETIAVLGPLART